MREIAPEGCVHCAAPLLTGDAFCAECGWCTEWFASGPPIELSRPLGEPGADYQLLRRRASGSAGTVYAARDRRTNEIVALKVIEGDSETLNRSLREYAVGRMVRSPGVVPQLRYWLADQCIVSVMPWIEGVSVRELLDSEGRLDVDECVWIIRGVALALAAAHAAGVVHRDVKPANVLLDLAGQPLLCDFGIAKLDDDPEKTELGAHVGSAAYMSPEQLTGRAEAASDQYALGIVAYELLAGTRPYQGATALVIASHLQAPPPSFGALRDVFGQAPPSELAGLFDAMVQKQPRDRIGSLREVASRLDPHSSEEARARLMVRVSRVRYRRFLADRLQLEMVRHGSSGVRSSPVTATVLPNATPSAAAAPEAMLDHRVAAPVGNDREAPVSPPIEGNSEARPSERTELESGSTSPLAATARPAARSRRRLIPILSAAAVLVLAGSSIWWARRTSDSSAVPGSDSMRDSVLAPIAVSPDSERTVDLLRESSASNVERGATTAPPPPRPVGAAPQGSVSARSSETRVATSVSPSEPIVIDRTEQPDTTRVGTPPLDVREAAVSRDSSRDEAPVATRSAPTAGELQRELASIFRELGPELGRTLSGPDAGRMVEQLKLVGWRARVVTRVAESDAARGVGSVVVCLTNAIGQREEFTALMRRDPLVGSAARWQVERWTRSRRASELCRG
jgi:hypothetical protein